MSDTSGIDSNSSMEGGEPTVVAVEQEATRSQAPKKFESHYLKIDPNQDDKATEIRLFSIARPHMRAFHAAWWCYHMAFLMW